MLSVDIVSPAVVDRVWPRITEKIDDACQRTGGDLSSAGLWQMCRTGNAFLIVVTNRKILSASIWQFQVWPSGQVFKCLCMVGYDNRMKEWLPIWWEFVKQKAKEGGSNRIITEGRKGWLRLFPEGNTLRQVYEVKL